MLLIISVKNLLLYWHALEVLNNSWWIETNLNNRLWKANGFNVALCNLPYVMFWFIHSCIIHEALNYISLTCPCHKFLCNFVYLTSLGLCFLKCKMLLGWWKETYLVEVYLLYKMNLVEFFFFFEALKTVLQ